MCHCPNDTVQISLFAVVVETKNSNAITLKKICAGAEVLNRGNRNF